MTKEQFEAKVEKFKRKATDATGKTISWCKENKEALVVIVPVLASSGVELIKILTRRGTVNEQKRLKDLYIYDRSGGHYYELRRRLKTREWIEFDERKNRGERVGEILRDMRVLKM